MDRNLEYIITSEYNDMPLNKYLLRHNYTVSILKKLRSDDSLVLVNDLPSFTNKILREGDLVHIKIPENDKENAILPVKLDFGIIYEDEDLIVVNKPYDMPIHPSMNNYENSLANALTYYYKDTDSPFIYRCIDRLDRNTSGLTIVAKNPLSASILNDQMKNRQIRKTYKAIVSGIVENESGTITAPIAREEESCIKRIVDFDNGEQAITHYQVLKYIDKKFTLLSFKLDTGRTHQIRVHMQYIGHPLIGDFLYNPDDDSLDRQALHADSIAFTHPVSREFLHFEAPLPEDMLGIIE